MQDTIDKDKLLIVEDDQDLRTQMKWGLIQDYNVLLSQDRQSAMEVFKKERPSLVTLDLGLPPQPDDVEEGLRVLAGILEQDSLAKVIIITGHDDKEHAISAIARGAYDFLTKPIQLDELRVILRRALYVSRLEREHRELQERLRGDSFEGMLGESPQIQKVISRICKVATTDSPVLLVGESGTGKELAAKAIHQMSDRKEGPFVVINCSAIPETLLESELFGHEKGAFTGAVMSKKGKFDQADKGTIFLDEIADMSLMTQAKILRILQEQSFERVGGNERIMVDVRVIAATNKDLTKEIEKGRFREDLYYRLNVIPFHVVPLRERKDDIPLFVDFYLKEFSRRTITSVPVIEKAALGALVAYDWPGNVRELKNLIERLIIMGPSGSIEFGDIPDYIRDTEPLEIAASEDGSNFKDARARFERQFIVKKLEEFDGNISKTAEAIGLERSHLYRKIKAYKIVA